MPFTFSHPAIVLPLTYMPKQWFSLTGLIIGSMAPDFEYFLRMKVQSDYSHTISGLFWFDLPLGLLFAFIFHNNIRDSLFDNLPTMLKSRFLRFKKFDWNKHFKKNWIAIIVSILIGAASHIFWDSFTHYNGYFVQLFSELTNTINVLDKQIPVLKIVQHFSTLFGGLILVFAVYKLPENKNVPKNIDPQYWIILTGVTLAIILMGFLGGLEIKQYGNVIVTVISAGLISLTLTPYLMKRKGR